MKDDFYKDIEHTRSDSTKNEKKYHQKRKNNVDENFSRSARYKKDEKTKNTESDKTDNNAKKSASSSGGFLTSSKKFLKKKSSHYKNQLSNELGESKSKLKDLKKESFEKFKPQKNGNKTPLLILLIILLPLTIVLGFMIVSNFWPTDDDVENQVAEEQTKGNKNEINKEFEDKKAEMEKEFAEKDKSDETDTDDADKETETNDEDSSSDASSDYDDDELDSLNKAGDSAISTKKDSDEKQENDESSNDDGEADESNNTDGQTHVISSKDNLYRIAIEYYGSGSEENVQKIRDANGISGNSLSVGQELIIP